MRAQRRVGRVDTSTSPRITQHLQAASSAHNHNVRVKQTLIKLSRKSAWGKSLSKLTCCTSSSVENLFLGCSAPLGSS